MTIWKNSTITLKCLYFFEMKSTYSISNKIYTFLSFEIKKLWMKFLIYSWSKNEFKKFYLKHRRLRFHRLSSYKKRQISNHNKFQKSQYSFLFWRLFFVETKYDTKTIERFYNFFVDRFNQKIFFNKIFDNKIDEKLFLSFFIANKSN